MRHAHLAVFTLFFLLIGVTAACDKQAPDEAEPAAQSPAVTPEEPAQSQPAAPPVLVSDTVGLITVHATGRTVEQAYGALKQAIEANEKLTVMAEFDHTANAKKADMELRPTRVIVFGNPALGSPLMQKSPTMALDLPQRMLVVESGENQVDIVYNDPSLMAARHGVTGEEERLMKIAGALKKLASVAAGGEIKEERPDQ